MRLRPYSRRVVRNHCPMSEEPPVKRVPVLIGAVFPADSELAQFILSLSLAMNDVGLVNGRLLRDLKEDVGSQAEHMYELRQATAQVWEVTELLRSSLKLSEVEPFVASLPQAATDALNSALAASGATEAVRSDLATVRNHSWHYPPPGSKVLIRALKATASHTSELVLGKGLARTRAVYADEVAVQFFSPSGDLSTEDFKRMLTETREILQDLITFITTAVGIYVSARVAQPPG